MGVFFVEKSYFFDSVEGDQRVYQAADFARFHAQIIGNGVSNSSNLPDLEVSAKENMDITLGAGYMFANGYMYENTSTKTLTHDIADTNNDRIDRVVIRFDSNPEERRIYATIKKGTPSSNPVPPSIVRNEYIYEMSVAQVRIIAGKSYIEQSQITDERPNELVCGYIPLHNIYRGLMINELGIVSLPNQSYVEVDIDSNFGSDPSKQFEIPDRIKTRIPLNPYVIDRQNEITKDNKFIAKSSGAYLLFAYLAFDEGALITDAGKSNTDVQVLFNVNGVEQTPIFAREASGHKDNIFSGSSVQYLEKGQAIDFVAYVLNAPDNLLTRNHRIRIAKIN